MNLQKPAAAILFGLVACVAIASSDDALAQTPPAFGPVESRAFAWKSGTTIERPAEAGCSNNSDWLVIRGANLSKVKSVDVTPRVTAWERLQEIPSANTCVAGDVNCAQVLLKVTNREAPGTYTVTLTHADGRKVKTTFDVVANAGRCDYSQGGKK